MGRFILGLGLFLCTNPAKPSETRRNPTKTDNNEHAGRAWRAGKTEIGPYLCGAAAASPDSGTYPPTVGVDLPDGGMGLGRRAACRCVLEPGTEISERETER